MGRSRHAVLALHAHLRLQSRPQTGAGYGLRQSAPASAHPGKQPPNLWAVPQVPLSAHYGRSPTSARPTSGAPSPTSPYARASNNGNRLVGWTQNGGSTAVGLGPGQEEVPGGPLAHMTSKAIAVYSSLNVKLGGRSRPASAERPRAAPAPAPVLDVDGSQGGGFWTILNPAAARMRCACMHACAYASAPGPFVAAWSGTRDPRLLSLFVHTHKHLKLPAACRSY